MEAIGRNILSNDWITILFLVILLLLVFSKQFFGERFYDFSRILYSNKYFTSNKKSLRVLNFFSFQLFLVHALLISLGLFILISQSNFIETTSANWILFIQIFVLYSLFISSKYFIEKIIGTIFSIEKLLDNYLFYKITYKNFLSLSLLPFLILSVYSFNFPTLWLIIIGGLLIFAHLFILFSYYKKQQKIVLMHWFYFILYLCTLEIAPYFILYKVIT
ncbi:hypothetical protein GGR31_000073 [Mesonia maritima]|uniref:DUF4271 domain-containing protein n=1 Tax=Mesonia maritima TaxID=1793873 RepID=A0ABU1K367_9FLAO|nr:hypothetical protein [Mesonia maritima]